MHSSPTSLGAVSGYQTSTFILEGFAFIVSTCMYVWKRFTEAWTTKYHSGYSMGTLVVGSMKVSGKRTRKKDSFYTESERERERERNAAIYCYIVGESWFSLPTPVQSSVPFLWIFVDVAISQCFQRYCNSYHNHNHNHNHNHDHTKCWQVSFNQNWPSQGHMVYLGPKGKAREDKSSWAKSRPI